MLLLCAYIDFISTSAIVQPLRGFAQDTKAAENNNVSIADEMTAMGKSTSSLSCGNDKMHHFFGYKVPIRAFYCPKGFAVLLFGVSAKSKNNQKLCDLFGSAALR